MLSFQRLDVYHSSDSMFINRYPAPRKRGRDADEDALTSTGAVPVHVVVAVKVHDNDHVKVKVKVNVEVTTRADTTTGCARSAATRSTRTARRRALLSRKR